MIKKRENPGFRGIDLNEDCVNALFASILADSATPKENKQACVPFQKVFGYEEESPMIFFNKTNLNNSKTIRKIRYLWGQLELVHKNGLLEPAAIVKKYDGTIWTKDQSTVMKLIYLGNASLTIGPFTAKFGNSSFAKGAVVPTLSPLDPKYADWFQQYEKDYQLAHPKETAE